MDHVDEDLPRCDPVVDSGDWRRVWREGIEPLLSDRSLNALRDALECGDDGLVQGQTVRYGFPQALEPEDGDGYVVPVITGACLVGYCGWRGEGLEVGDDVVQFFIRFVEAVDRRLDGELGIVSFVRWFDSMPRSVVWPALLAEVQAALAAREVPS